MHTCWSWRISSGVQLLLLPLRLYLRPLLRLPPPSRLPCLPQPHLPCRMGRPPQVPTCLRNAIAANRRMSPPGCPACAISPIPENASPTSFSVTSASAICLSRTLAIRNQPSQHQKPNLPPDQPQQLVSWQLAPARTPLCHIRVRRRRRRRRRRPRFLPPVPSTTFFTADALQAVLFPIVRVLMLADRTPACAVRAL
jgi:hypothetical protein